VAIPQDADKPSAISAGTEDTPPKDSNASLALSGFHLRQVHAPKKIFSVDEIFAARPRSATVGVQAT
jgi:hypothetical protein